MLAAEKSPAGFLVLGWHSITVRLQSGLLPDKSLDDAALQRAEDAICTLAQQARAYGAERIRAFGTSALRDAKNAGELAERVRNRAQVELTVISGVEEAESAFRAAAPAGEAMVVNPGGGSTEMIIGRDGTILSAVSAHIGAVSLMAEASALSPAEVVERAKAHISKEFSNLTAPVPAKIIASGGAAACTADVLLALPKRDSNKVEGYVLTLADASALLESLFSLTVEERIALPGMNPGRADILPYGLAILIAFMQISGRSALTISDRGNLYGFIEMV